MQPLANAELLTLWEHGVGLHPLDQGLLALSAVLPQVPLKDLADWPLGERNRALVTMHCTSFNPRLQAWASCNQCGEKMEFELDAEALVAHEGDEDAALDQLVTVKGHSFRLPTSRDLAQAARERDSLAAAACLVERCWTGDGESPVWSDADLDEIGEAMAQADSSAEIRVSLRCPECRREWDEALDLATFLWAEVEARARQLLWEIHTLASAYGWTQTEILSLSQKRRSSYLEMAQA
jgi:hypothetical protein